jgi:hypothetical protein
MKMSMLISMPEHCNIVQAAQPQTTNAAINSKYINLKNAVYACVFVHLTQAVGHATPISLFQAQDIAGIGAKALARNVPIWANEDAAATDQFVRQADGVSYAVLNNAKNKVIAFYVDPNKLDINNGFKTLQVRIGASGEATNFATIEVCVCSKYPQANPPSVLVD